MKKMVLSLFASGLAVLGLTGIVPGSPSEFGLKSAEAARHKELVADGPHPETGPMAVIGGMGAFRGASGELSSEIIGTNITGCPNVRVKIGLDKKAPR